MSGIDHHLEQVRSPLTIAASRSTAPIAPRASTLSSKPMRWLDGGPIADWTPISTRNTHRVDVQHAPHRVFLTEVARPQQSEAARRWLALQSLLVASEPASDDWDTDVEPRETGPLVFWRVVVGRRAFGLGASAAPSVDLAVAQARRLAKRARKLQVSFAYFANDPRPLWAAHDNGKPMLLGLPDHHLALTDDRGASIAAVLADAQPQRYIHHVETSEQSP